MLVVLDNILDHPGGWTTSFCRLEPLQESSNAIFPFSCRIVLDLHVSFQLVGLRRMLLAGTHNLREKGFC